MLDADGGAADVTVLSPREASIFACVADTLLAPAPPLPPIGQTDAVRAFDAWLARAPRDQPHGVARGPARAGDRAAAHPRARRAGAVSRRPRASRCWSASRTGPAAARWSRRCAPRRPSATTATRSVSALLGYVPEAAATRCRGATSPSPPPAASSTARASAASAMCARTSASSARARAARPWPARWPRPGSASSSWRTARPSRTHELTARPRDMTALLYRDAGQSATAGTPTIMLPTGRAVGGTTLVNSGTCFRVPARGPRRSGRPSSASTRSRPERSTTSTRASRRRSASRA